jgi:hypothetical protein
MIEAAAGHIESDIICFTTVVTREDEDDRLRTLFYW